MDLKEDSTTLMYGPFFEELSFHQKAANKRTLFSIKDVLYQGRSKFQDIFAFESNAYGRVLVLNGVVQLTEFDEFSYHETLAFTTLACHPDPKKVLIVGGGDGGMAREALKFPSVESVTVCDIDEEVVNVSKKFFPGLAKSFKSPKVHLVIQDALEFLKSVESIGMYDVIISDACDPDVEGPQISLASEEFIRMLQRSLTPHGVLCVQTGNTMWQYHPVAIQLVRFCQKIFPVVRCSYAQVASFYLCQNGFIICGNDKTLNPSSPKWEFTEEELNTMELKCYSTSCHKAAFAVPRFADICDPKNDFRFMSALDTIHR